MNFKQFIICLFLTPYIVLGTYVASLAAGVGASRYIDIYSDTCKNVEYYYTLCPLAGFAMWTVFGLGVAYVMTLAGLLYVYCVRNHTIHYQKYYTTV